METGLLLGVTGSMERLKSLAQQPKHLDTHLVPHLQAYSVRGSNILQCFFINSSNPLGPCGFWWSLVFRVLIRNNVLPVLCRLGEELLAVQGMACVWGNIKQCWELVQNAESWTPSQEYHIRNCILPSPLGYVWCTSKFGELWSFIKQALGCIHCWDIFICQQQWI